MTTSTISELMLNRRQALGLGAAAVASLGLAACSSDGADSTTTTDDSSSDEDSEDAEDQTVALDATAYDALIATGPVAEDSVVTSNSWASAIRDAGTFREGGVQTSMLFSLLNETDGVTRGFDAGLAQLLTRYILGDESKIEITLVTSDTRESLLQNDQVDAVFATYSITDKRKEVIDFAGPYYTTQQAILVLADNTDINSVDDLAGKTVAVQSGSTGPSIVEEYAPDAAQEEFSTDEEARNALETGRVDAYVIDETMQMGSMVRNPGKYRIAGDAFGPVDPYGIGLPLGSDAKEFVNEFLTTIEGSGLWADLWQICIGNRAGIDTVPDAPQIEE